MNASESKQLAKAAARYAKRLATEQDLALKVPEEWDFRPVKESELEDVIAYEYGREQPALNAMMRELYQFFPLPWLAVEFESPRSGSRRPVVSILPVGDRLAQMNLAGMHRLAAWHGWLVDADFSRHKVKDIVADFARWARVESAKHKRQSGKASAPPWHKLKAMAAFRLHRAGLRTFSKAADHANKRNSECPCNCYGDVLPIYTSAGGWHDAVASVRAELSTT